jgi:hypothetical protein
MDFEQRRRVGPRSNEIAIRDSTGREIADFRAARGDFGEVVGPPAREAGADRLNERHRRTSGGPARVVATV